MHPIRRIFPALTLALLLAPPVVGQSTTASGVSNAFNPAISVNSLLLGRVSDKSNDHDYNKSDLQEAEVQLTSIVDPFWRANLVFAVHPAHTHAHDLDEAEATADAHSGYSGDVEVAAIEGQAIPWGFGLALGKDYLPFGKHVPLHTHQFPFVDAPAAVKAFLGDHGLTEVGVRLSHDLPLPWYSDLTVYAVDGKAEIFAGDSRELVYGGRWTHLADLSMESTLELGGSALHGPLAADYLLIHTDETLGGSLDIWGADLTYKWVSASASRGPALTVTGEVILPRPQQGAQDPYGWYALAQYRFRRNWWLGLGAGGLSRELSVHEEEDTTEEHAPELFNWREVHEYKIDLTWVPSEFSAVRFEAARYDDVAGDLDDTLFSVQINFTIGSHPAHLY